jgi:hypothetical protein
MSHMVDCPKCGVEKILSTCSQCSACEICARERPPNYDQLAIWWPLCQPSFVLGLDYIWEERK